MLAQMLVRELEMPRTNLPAYKPPTMLPQAAATPVTPHPFFYNNEGRQFEGQLAAIGIYFGEHANLTSCMELEELTQSQQW